MRAAVRSIVLAAALAAALAPAARAADLHLSPPVVRSLPNGLRIEVFPDHRLPLVQVQVMFPAGSAREPAEAPGAAAAVAQLLRAGTSSRTAFGLSADLDQIAGTLAPVAARDYSSVGGTFLARDLDAGLELLADVVVNPLFPPEEVNALRLRQEAALAQARQSAGGLADAALWATAFAGHPYERDVRGVPGGMERLDPIAVRAFHRAFYRPARAVLAIAGDVDPERAFAVAADRFGAWAGRAAPAPEPAAPAPPATGVIQLVDRPGADRCEVRVGLVLPARADSDLVPLQIAIRILAGGADARLARAARDGSLAFDVRGSATLLREAGLLSLGAGARADSGAALVAAIRGALEGLRTRPPTAAEVAAAQRAIANGWPLQFQGAAAVMTQSLAAEANGLPLARLERYPSEVAAADPARVAAAAARWLDPARAVVVVVGPAGTLRAPLAALGGGEVRGGAPEPRAAAAEPAQVTTPEQARRGRELLGQALVAHGGIARLRRVRDSDVQGDMVLMMGPNQVQVEMRQIRKDPMRMRFITRMGTMENGQVLSGSRGWMYVLGDSLQVVDADSLGVQAMRTAFRSDVVHTLLAAADSMGTVAWRGRARVDGRDADQLEVTLRARPGQPAERRTLYLDAKDHRLIAEETRTGPGERAPAMRKVYRDLRPVNGVIWPFYEERLLEGTRTMTLMVREVKLDAGIPDGVFDRPALKAPDRPLR